MINQDTATEELESLRAEHRVLDERIDNMSNDGTYARVDMQRLKKRKLAIKDQMARLESNLLPDIIA
jgi:hypothetical protein